MKRTLWLLSVLFFSSFFSPALAQNAPTTLKAIRFGKLIDGTGKVWTNAIVIVKGDRIQSVGEAGASIPSDAQVIDMSAFTGMPGLIDIHTHMTYWWSGNPHSTPNAETARLLPQELVFMAQENARKTLDIGVTTVRDMLQATTAILPCAT